jgi:plasmid stabilization system protein ParE
LKAVRFEPLAESDIQSARRFYEEKRAGLGDEFFAAALSQCRSIALYPLAARVAEGEVRKAPMSSKFHYDIYYYIEAEEIIVVAVMHRRQHPDSWKKRR